MFGHVRRRFQSAESDVPASAGRRADHNEAIEPVSGCQTGRVQGVQQQAVPDVTGIVGAEPHLIRQPDVRAECAEEEDHAKDRRHGHRL